MYKVSRESIDRGGTHKFAYICIYIPLHRPIAAATAYLPPRDPSPSDSPGRPWAPSLDREYVPIGLVLYYIVDLLHAFILLN